MGTKREQDMRTLRQDKSSADAAIASVLNMTKLNITYYGFKLGLRDNVANAYALQYTPGNELQTVGLHAIKNLVNVDNMESELGICSINGAYYSAKGE